MIYHDLTIRMAKKSQPKGKQKKKQLWGRDVVIALQNYTYKIWKARNEILHGCNNKENREKKRAMQIKNKITIQNPLPLSDIGRQKDV